MQAHGHFTRRNIAGVICFTLLFCALFALADGFFWNEREYCSVWTRLREQKTVPDVLIVGNSHAFCSFVPDILNGALGIDSAVLASSGGDARAVRDSVAAALDVGKPKLLIVEINAFYSEDGIMARAHKYSALGNINGMPSITRRAEAAYRELGLESVPQGMFQLLRAELMWKRWSAVTEEKPANRYEGVDVLGYQSLDWFATGGYQSEQVPIYGDAASADEALLGEAARAELRQLLSLARERGVEVWLVKTPLAMREVKHPNAFDAARLIASQYGDTVTFCRDYNDELPEMRLTSSNFYDGGHLNRRGAAKFTLRFAEELGERFGIAPDPDAAFAYLDEEITPMEDNCFRYEMKSLGRGVLYRFELDNNGERELLSDWSDVSFVELELRPEEADRLIVSMCPAGIPHGERDVYMNTLRFMTADSCVLD